MAVAEKEREQRLAVESIDMKEKKEIIHQFDVHACICYQMETWLTEVVLSPVINITYMIIHCSK